MSELANLQWGKWRAWAEGLVKMGRQGGGRAEVEGMSDGELRELVAHHVPQPAPGATKPPMPVADRQAAVMDWVRRCFGDAFATPAERAMRIVEETLELAQVEGLDPARLHFLVDYVFSRPVGEAFQEVGGIRITVLSYAAAKGLSAEDAEVRELERILARDPELFRKRNQEKVAAGVSTNKKEAS